MSRSQIRLRGCLHMKSATKGGKGFNKLFLIEVGGGVLQYLIVGFFQQRNVYFLEILIFFFGNTLVFTLIFYFHVFLARSTSLSYNNCISPENIMSSK